MLSVWVSGAISKREMTAHSSHRLAKYEGDGVNKGGKGKRGDAGDFPEDLTGYDIR